MIHLSLFFLVSGGEKIRWLNLAIHSRLFQCFQIILGFFLFVSFLIASRREPLGK